MLLSFARRFIVPGPSPGDEPIIVDVLMHLA